MLIGLMPDEMLKEYVASGLDKIEESIRNSKNTWDDMALPIIDKLQAAMGIEDTNDPE